MPAGGAGARLAALYAHARHSSRTVATLLAVPACLLPARRLHIRTSPIATPSGLATMTRATGGYAPGAISALTADERRRSTRSDHRTGAQRRVATDFTAVAAIATIGPRTPAHVHAVRWSA